MKDSTIQTVIPAVLVSLAGIAPAGAAFAAGSHANTAAKAVVFKGPEVDMRWGPVQASITVKNKKITKVGISVSPENPRSQFIDDQAVPMLQSQTLQAQNANIDEVSGATNTSDAFVESLQGAIKKAKHVKALK